MKQEAAKAVLKDCSSPLTPTVVRLYGVYLLCITFLQTNSTSWDDGSDETLNEKELLNGTEEYVIQALYGSVENAEKYLQEDMNTLGVKEWMVVDK